MATPDDGRLERREEALRRLVAGLDVPEAVLDMTEGFHWTQLVPPGRCMYPHCDCPPNGPCLRPCPSADEGRP